MAGKREDANLIVELAKWGSMIGLPEASRTIFSDDFDQESAEALDPHVQTILVFHETVGTLVKNDLLDRDLVLDWLWVSGAWDRVGHGGAGGTRPRRRAAAVGELRGAGADPGVGEPPDRPRVPARLRPYAPWRDPIESFLSPSSTPASAASPCCTSASCRFRTRTSSTSGDTARFPYGDRSRRGAARLRARARRHPARPRGEAARGRLQLGHRGGAARAAGGARAGASRWWAS